MASEAHGTNRGEGTMIGVVFNAEGLDVAGAASRAWHLWMQRLDPHELRGTALYDGATLHAGDHHVYIIAISGSAQVVRYVRDAFAAPDLLAFPGVAPISHRFIAANELPRQDMELRGYIGNGGELQPLRHDRQLAKNAQRASWAYAPPPESESLTPSRPNASQTPSRPNPASLPHMPAYRPEPAHEPTTMLQAAPLDGATQVMLRLWKPSFSANDRNTTSRGRILAIIGTLLILGSFALIGLRFAGKTQGQSLPVTATATPSRPSNGPEMIVAPLALRAPCVPGSQGEFTISNNGNQPLNWQSNGAQFEPPLSLHAISGTVNPGNTQTVSFTTDELVITQSVDTLNITSDGGQANVAITIGGCTAPTATPTVHP